MERQYVGIDLHRRSTTLFRMTEDVVDYLHLHLHFYFRRACLGSPGGTQRQLAQWRSGSCERFGVPA